MRQTQCWTHIYFLYLHPDVHLYGLEYKELQFLSHNNVSSRQSSPHRQYGKLLCLSFQKNGFKELDFLCIKLLANFFHPPYITEEISTQCSVSIDDLFYCVNRVYIISNNFSSGEIFFSATRFIISDRISNSDSTTAK